jgi:hypothetical protein
MAATLDKLIVSDNGNHAEKLFAIHAHDCPDLSKRRCHAWAQDLSDAADQIAALYGGYGDGNDAPANAQHALSWATVKSCAKKILKEVR